MLAATVQNGVIGDGEPSSSCHFPDRSSRRICVVMLLLWFSLPVSAQGLDRTHEPNIPADHIIDRRASSLGQRISVSAIVHRVVGPRLFTVTATDQLDGDKEMLVFVPSPQLAAVRKDSRVMITGTVRASATSVIKDEWGSGADAFTRRIHVDGHEIIVAEAIIVDGIDVAVSAGDGWQSADSASTTVGTFQDLAALASSDDSTLVGRLVDLKNARISAVAAMRGFWVSSDDEQLFVLPGDAAHLRQGARVNIRGFVLELPEDMKDRLGDYLAARDEAIYVYANQVRTL